MKDRYLKLTTSFITKYHTYDDDELDKLRYGLEGIYLSGTKLIIMTLIAIIIGIIKEFILLLIFFNIIRFTGFGFHAGKSYQCLIFSTLLFIGVPVIMLYGEFSKTLLISVGMICLVPLAIYAPADTVKRPLPNKKKRKIRKFSTILITLIYIILIVHINNYSINSMLICSLILESIMVLPLTYKIFKQPYRNYRNYNQT